MFLINTREEWKKKGMKKLGFDFTDEELDRAKNEASGKGYIGTRNGMACYLSEFVATKNERIENATYFANQAPDVEIKVPKQLAPRTIMISHEHNEKVEQLAQYLNISRRQAVESLIDQYLDKVY